MRGPKQPSWCYNPPSVTMPEHATISTDILASYAADAAREVDGVRRLVDSNLPRQRGARVTDEEGRITVELHIALEWGTSIQEVGRMVQRRVADYLGRMADVQPSAVDVVVDDITAP